MNDTTIYILIGIVSFLILCLLITILIVSHNKKVKIVKNNSELLNSLKQLNEQYKKIFKFDLQLEFYHNHRCEKKYNYDRLSVKNAFYLEIKENYDYYCSLAKDLIKNRENIPLYKDKYLNLKSTITEEQTKVLKINYKSFIKIENKLYKKNRLFIPYNIRFECIVSYISPAGRNHYSKSDIFNFEALEETLEEIKINEEQKKTYEYKKKMERLKLTDSMRYDVMRRDGFKCVICGATAKEGAKLHVDHIVPIAKGGLTEMSNLRTLCDRCNLGKSDKIEA